MLDLKNIDLWKAIIRFPIACLMATIATCLGMYMIDLNEPPARLINILLCSIVGALCNIAWTVATEAYSIGLSKRWIGRVMITLCLLVGYYLFLPSSYEVYNTSLFRLPFQMASVILFLHLLISYIPYLTKGSEEDFWEYNKDVFLNFVEAVFYAGFLFVGLSIALLALDKLFGVDIDDLAYPRLWFFLIGIFNTFYFLSKYPTVYYDNNIKTPIKAFLIFSQYILIPLVLIYMAILYVYGIQIGFKWELPEGWVSQLSLWFSVVGIFAYLLNYFNHKFSDFRLTALFKKYFFLILVLPTILVFVAIYRRISEYGITELRYVVALLGVWLLCMALYFNFSKSKHIRVIPISLSIFILLPILLGPFSIFNATLSSQQKKFKQLLLDTGCLVDQQLIAVNDTAKTILNPRIAFSTEVNDATVSKGEVLYNAIRFLDERSDLGFINNWIEPDLDLVKESDPSIALDSLDRYHNTRIVAEQLNISSLVPENYKNPDLTRFNINQIHDRSIELGDNKYFVTLNNVYSNDDIDQDTYITLDRANAVLVLHHEDQLLGNIPLDTFLTEHITEHSTPKEKEYNFGLESPVMTYEDPAFRATLIFKNISGLYSSDSVFSIQNIWGHALIDIKE